jgi:succinoglycan biosynthesis protein ExoM
MRLSVVIPTLRRPVELERAIRSVMAQTGRHARPHGLVVADNDPDGSARALVERLATEAAFPIVYAHAPRPGVATARNAALAATDADLIAFLDDDEIASPGWLTALVEAREALGADVVFGPIQGRAPTAASWQRPYLERFFGRDGPDTDQRIDEPYGCGNSLFLRARTLQGPAPFDVGTDQSGGEDDALFQTLAKQGAIWGWASNAWVEEAAPAHRANLSYALTRAFAFGQGPSQKAARDRDWPDLIRWMAIGAGQAIVFGTVAAAHWLTGRASRADWTDRAARGLGKLFWMSPFEPRLYGLAELKRAERSS